MLQAVLHLVLALRRRESNATACCARQAGERASPAGATLPALLAEPALLPSLTACLLEGAESNPQFNLDLVSRAALRLLGACAAAAAELGLHVPACMTESGLGIRAVALTSSCCQVCNYLT